jgi:RNA polymerase sigma-70 factor (ECF subfamily)
MMNRTTSFSDQDLINLGRKGHQDAYNLLLLRYHNKIEQIIQSYIRERANVSDLRQEVLIKVYRFLPHFNENSQFSTWVYRITQNTIKNYYRANTLRMDVETEFTDNYYSSDELSPEYLLINIEFGEQLEDALSTLSEDLRICYGMRLLDGQSYEDIAKKMDCPVGTVRSRIFRARKLVQESIDQFN